MITNLVCTNCNSYLHDDDQAYICSSFKYADGCVLPTRLYLKTYSRDMIGFQFYMEKLFIDYFNGIISLHNNNRKILSINKCFSINEQSDFKNIYDRLIKLVPLS